jgi:hypothetical protein
VDGGAEAGDYRRESGAEDCGQRGGASGRCTAQPDLSLAARLRTVANGFAQVLIGPPEAASAVAGEGATCAGPAIEVELAGRARFRIPAAIPTELAAAVIKALARGEVRGWTGMRQSGS